MAERKMRYTCFQKIVTKVYDGILEDNSEISLLLSELKNNDITCSLTISSGQYVSVRILSVEDDKFSWRFYQRGAGLKKISLFSDIKALEVVVSDAFVAAVKPNASRWNTLDTSGL